MYGTSESQKENSWTAWHLRMGSVVCSETSVTFTAAERARRAYLLCGRSQKFLTQHNCIVQKIFEYCVSIFFRTLWRFVPYSGHGVPFYGLYDHTHTHSVGLLWASYRPVAETALQYTTLIHPFPQRDSNPQSQQASCRRPTLEAARPLERHML